MRLPAGPGIGGLPRQDRRPESSDAVRPQQVGPSRGGPGGGGGGRQEELRGQGEPGLAAEDQDHVEVRPGTVDSKTLTSLCGLYRYLALEI